MCCSSGAINMALLTELGSKVGVAGHGGFDGGGELGDFDGVEAVEVQFNFGHSFFSFPCLRPEARCFLWDGRNLLKGRSRGKRFFDSGKGFGGRGEGFGGSGKGVGGSGRGFGCHRRDFGDCGRSKGCPQRSFGDSQRGFGCSQNGFGRTRKGFGSGWSCVSN